MSKRLSCSFGLSKRVVGTKVNKRLMANVRLVQAIGPNSLCVLNFDRQIFKIDLGQFDVNLVAQSKHDFVEISVLNESHIFGLTADGNVYDTCNNRLLLT